MAVSISKKSKKTCSDQDCPFHGRLSIRGRMLEGTVISAKMEKAVVVRRNFLNYVPKFKRYKRKHSHISAHNPPCIDAKEGDLVKMAECRPLSKTISFVVIDILEKK